MKILIAIRKVLTILWSLYIFSCIVTGHGFDVYQIFLLGVYVLLTGVQDYQVIPDETKNTLSD